MKSIRAILKSALRLRTDFKTFNPGFGGWKRTVSREGFASTPSRFGRLHYRPSDTDIDVFRHVFVGREYDIRRFWQYATILERYHSILASGDKPVIVDAGANIGASAMWFSQEFPNAIVVGVEPDPENARLAALNTRRHSVLIVTAAIGSVPGFVSLDHSKRKSWAVQTSRSSAGVEVVTVADCVARIDRGRLLIVKVDIEGFESDLFRENLAWIDEAMLVIVEVHDWMLPGKGTSQSLQKAMLGRGMEILIMGENLAFTPARQVQPLSPTSAPDASKPARDRP